VVAIAAVDAKTEERVANGKSIMRP